MNRAYVFLVLVVLVAIAVVFWSAVNDRCEQQQTAAAWTACREGR